MKNTKKILATLLAVCILLTNLPTEVSAKTPTTSNTYIEITKDSTKLRNGPGEKYDTILTAERGDCFIYTGYKKNSHGNVFFKCHLNGSTEELYVYEKNVIFHEHIYNYVSEHISVCKCGEYILNTESSLVQTSLAATAGSFLTADAVAGSLSVAGSSATLHAAFPVVAIVSIGALFIYMAVSSTAAQVDDVICFESEMDVKNYLESEFDAKTPYHKAVLTPEGDILVIARDGMDISDANKYLKSLSSSLTYAAICTLTQQSMLNIWCHTEKQADDLGKRFSKNGPAYGYGQSSDSNCYYEIDNEQRLGSIYFKHYHLWYKPYDLRFLKKVDDVHIFFGLPVFANNA